MVVRIIMLLTLLLFVDVSAAEEIRSPVCPVSSGSAPCIMNGTNSPGLLGDYEMIYLNISNGYYLTEDNFYYAGINSKNREIDLFSKRYNIVTVNSADAVLTTDIYNNKNNLQLYTGKELKLKDGYTLELVNVFEDSALFYLKKNNEILETDAVDRNKTFSYRINMNGREVEIFRMKLIGISGNSTVIKDTYLKDIRVIKNGESSGNYKITLEDIDGDGDIDIVYSLKNKILHLPDNGITQILDNFLTLRTYPAYIPFYQSLEMFNITGEDSRFRIYSLSDNLTMPVSSFLSSPPEGSIIASGMPARINTEPNVTYKDSNSSISELRGDHTFYIYTKGDLSLSIKKQDLNWYNGSDALEIKLYSGNKLLKNATIPDDGNIENKGKRGALQNGTLEASIEGMYRVTMTGGSDLVVSSIELNNGNIVVKNPFLAGILYTNATTFNLYTKAARGDRLGFYTAHNEGLQTVNISSGSFMQSLNITAVNQWHYIDLPPSTRLYQVEVPRGDIIINANSYFSFSNDSYFGTSSVKVLPLQNNMDWLNKNRVDYVIAPSSNPFVGLYFFKIKNAEEFYVRSPKSPWADYTIDTWSAPDVFYFNPDKNSTWEYLIINSSGGNNLNRENLRYIAIQTRGNIGFRGNLYKVLHEVSSEIILSKKLSNVDNKTLFLEKEWQVGGKYTLTLKGVDGEGRSAVLELSRSNKPVDRQIVSVGSKMFYNSSFNGKNVIIFQGKLDEVFQVTNTNTSFVKLQDIELYDEDMTVIKSGVSIRNETAYLSDVNRDGFLDIVVMPDRDLVIEKGLRKKLFDSYLDLVVEDNGRFYLERKITSSSAITNSSNIKKEVGYTFASFFPAYNTTLIFSDFDITAISINASRFIDQIKVNLKEFKNRPDDIIISPKGEIYKYFSISIDNNNIKDRMVYFRVNKSWLTYKNIDNTSITLSGFSGGVWESLPTYRESSDEWYEYYSGKLNDFSTLFAITGSGALEQTSSPQPQSKSNVKQRNLFEEYKLDPTVTPAQTDSSGNVNSYSIFSLFLLGSIIFSGYFIYKKFEILKFNKIILYFSRLNVEMFNLLLLTFSLLLLIDTTWNNIISKYINLNYLMFIVFFFGIISLYSNSATGISSKSTKKEYTIITGIGILGFIIIWSKIKHIGFTSYPISIISGILIVLLSILMLEDSDK